MDMIVLLIGVLAALLIFFLPSIFAFKRNHAYKNIILVLNIFGFTGIAWLIALIWAIYPSEKSLIDPVLGNFTGTGTKNVGDTIGEVTYGSERGYETAKSGNLGSKLTKPNLVNDDLVAQLERLSRLHAAGSLSDDEYRKLKNDLLGIS